MGDVQVLHVPADLLEVGKGLLRAVPQQKRHEFLSAVTGEKIRAALEPGGRRAGHGGNHLIAGGMAEGVVVHLEFVNVEHTDGEGNLQAGGLLPLGQAVEVVAAAVGNAGELVRHGLVLHLLAVLVQLDVGIHPGLDDQRVAGLADVVHRPQSQPPLLTLDVGEAGNQDDWNVPGDHLLLQLLQQHKTIHLRHDHVQQDQGIIP